jgi:hypothetical protein
MEPAGDSSGGPPSTGWSKEAIFTLVGIFTALACFVFGLLLPCMRKLCGRRRPSRGMTFLFANQDPMCIMNTHTGSYRYRDRAIVARRQFPKGLESEERDRG